MRNCQRQGFGKNSVKNILITTTWEPHIDFGNKAQADKTNYLKPLLEYFVNVNLHAKWLLVDNNQLIRTVQFVGPNPITVVEISLLSQLDAIVKLVDWINREMKSDNNFQKMCYLICELEIFFNPNGKSGYLKVKDSRIPFQVKKKKPKLMIV